MATTLSPNMNLPVPVVGQEPGPDYANDVNNSLNIVDGHNHSTGYGVQITPTGLDINADLPINNNNLTLVRTLRLMPQVSTPIGPLDLGALYETGVDLYYIDGAGNNVRITQGGSVAGAPGSISNLVSPASASYNAGSSTFVWQSAVSTPANMDFAAATLRNLVANSKGLTLQPPAAMASDYTLVLPPLPVSQKIMTLDASGNITAPYVVDNSTITISSNTIQVATNGIQLSNLSVDVQQALILPGFLQAYGGSSAPSGWLICDGTAVSRITYAALYTAIGNAYGNGDGSTTFTLPDMRGNFVRGTNLGSTNDPDASSRVASASGGNTGDNVGSFQESIYQSHSHQITVYHSGATSVSNFVGQAVTNFASSLVPDSAVGGAETRPINTYFTYIIKT